MPNRSYSISKKAQENVCKFLRMRYDNFPMSNKRHRLEVVDKAMQLESDERRNPSKDQRLDYYDDTELSMISPAVDTMQGFFVDLYLTERPIFPVISNNRENEESVIAFNAVNENNAQEFGWGRHLALFFRDCAKYNLGAVEVNWETKSGVDIVPPVDPTVSPNQEAVLDSIKKEGNAINRWDLYNTFYDTSVPPAEIHERGEFAATIERVTMIDLVQTFADYKLGGNHVMNEDAAFNYGLSGSITNRHYIPDVTPEFDATTAQRFGPGDWGDFFGVPQPSTKSGAKHNILQKFEKVTLYARIIPSMFGIKVPAADRIQVWKFVIINWDTVVYAERQSNMHSMLPTVFSQVREDGLGEQTKSAAELLIPLQNLSTKIYDARLEALAKAAGQRFAYAEGVDESDLTKRSGNIKFKRTALAQDIRQALMPLNFTDTVGGVYLNELGFLKEQAQETTRLNRPQLGQFQKGNKTLGEFRAVMDNANAELRVMGILLEAQPIHAVKSIIKYNVLQYQSPKEMIDPETGKQITVNPSVLRDSALQYKLADGLATKEDYIDTQLLREFIMLVREDPTMRASYDLVGLLTYLFTMQGAKIKQFEIPEAQRQQAQQPPTGNENPR